MELVFIFEGGFNSFDAIGAVALDNALDFNFKVPVLGLKSIVWMLVILQSDFGNAA